MSGDSSEDQVVVNVGSGVVGGLVIDWQENQLYFTDTDNGVIRRVDLATNASTEAFSSLTTPRAITLQSRYTV